MIPAMILSIGPLGEEILHLYLWGSTAWLAEA
jgi:hypothetical protein